MHTDARKLENNTKIEGDICIVGAGAAGISMALDWNKNGKNVILCVHAGCTYLEGQPGIGEVCAPHLIR